MRRILMLTSLFILALAACGEASAPANSVTPTTAATDPSGGYAALPQSKTPDGYYVLGRSDAPIVMTHYSDFL